MSQASFTLFHRIADSSSARVRRFIAEHDLLEAVRYRNVDFPEHAQKLAECGGSVERVPALFDGQRLHVGADAIIARLQAHADVGRAGP